MWVVDLCDWILKHCVCIIIYIYVPIGLIKIRGARIKHFDINEDGEKDIFLKSIRVLKTLSYFDER